MFRGFLAFPVFRGVPECSAIPASSGVPVFRCSGVPVFRCSGVPGFSTCQQELLGTTKIIFCSHYLSLQPHNTSVQLFSTSLPHLRQTSSSNLHTFEFVRSSPAYSSAILKARGLLSLACMQLPVFSVIGLLAGDLLLQCEKPDITRK